MNDSPQTPPAPEAEAEDPLAFTPVPHSGNHNGWSPKRQRDFIAALAVMGVVSRACKAVGLSKQSAYKLRLRPGAESFAEAWDIALEMGYDRAYSIAVERALTGITTPRFYRGRQVGSIHRYDNRMLIAALNAVAPTPPRNKVAE